MAEAIVYVLPTGKRVVQDLDRVLTIPSEGGKVSFTTPDRSKKIGPFRVVRFGTEIEYVVSDNEITEALTTIELEPYDGSDKGNE